MDTIVLLHGFPESSASWREITPRLTAAGYRVLAPDQRGYAGDNRPRRRRDYTLPKLAGDVLALADEEGVDRFHVVGHDWGGAVAWQLAATHADRLLTMTSLATPHPQAMVRSLLRGRFFRRQLVDSGMPDDYVDEVFRHQLVDKTSTIW